MAQRLTLRGLHGTGHLISPGSSSLRGGPLLGLVNVFEQREDWDQARLHAQQAWGA